MAVKILHLADLHLGYAPGFLSSEKSRARSAELKSAFERAIEFAIKPANSISAVIIAGDLFETPSPDQATRGFARAQLGRLSAAAIPALIVPGTHDTIGLPESVYKTEAFPPGVHILAPPFSTAPLELTLGSEKFFFYWFTYDPAEKGTISEYLAGVEGSLPRDGYKVFIAHASLMGSQEWNMTRKSLPVTLEELRSSGMHYVALGHYHNFFESGREGPGVAKVVYPGTLEGKAFGENGGRYLVVANFENGGASVEKHPFNRRVLEEKTMSLDSEPASSEEELLKRLESLGNQNLLLRLTLTGSPDFVVRADFLAQVLADKFFYLEIEDSTSVLSSIAVEETMHERTIRGMFLRRLKEMIDARSAAETGGPAAETSVPAIESRQGASPGKRQGASPEKISRERAVCELALKEGLNAFFESGHKK